MVTVVMAAYNEEEIIERSVEEWYHEVVSKLPDANLLVVDDCSTDGTGRVLERLAARLPAVRCVRPERNGGHGKALRLGFRHVTGEYVFQTDSDRQHLPVEFWNLWKLKDEQDFVFGVRNNRADGTLRAVITRIMRLLNFLLWGVWIRDANCPFKLMRRHALERVLEKIPETCFVPMVALSILARKTGFQVAEVPVTHVARRGGTQSLRGLTRWAQVGFLCARQLVWLRLRYREGPASARQPAA